jgi:hypothetical protein
LAFLAKGHVARGSEMSMFETLDNCHINQMVPPPLGLDIVEFEKRDNELCILIYKKMKEQLLESLKVYPLPENIYGIFFQTIIKLTTQNILKAREIEYSLVPTTPEILSPVIKWPFLSYSDLEGNLDLEKKEYGAQIKLPPQSLSRKAISMMSSISSYTLGKRATIGMAGSCIDKKLAKIGLKMGYHLDWIEPPTGWKPRVRKLNEQVQQLKIYLEEINSIVELPLSPSLFFELLSRHILAIMSEGEPLPLGKYDAIICGSGMELGNRLLASTTLHHGGLVYNVLHGDSFGVLDKACFGIGEQLLSTGILGYGESYLDDRKTFEFDIPFERTYVPGSSYLIKEIFKSNQVKNSKLEGTIYYVPTSLRGATCRFGPFQDAADGIYLNWEKYVMELFGEQLKVKVHPKDRFRHLYQEYHSRSVKTNLIDMVEEIDIFVFDYVSTAFTVAAATDRPIIFFDLGIQNYSQKALNAIKDRTVYFAPSELENLDVAEISRRLEGEKKVNRYTEEFCLSQASPDRAMALFKSITQVLGNRS